MKKEGHSQAEKGKLKTHMKVKILVYLEKTKYLQDPGDDLEIRVHILSHM